MFAELSWSEQRLRWSQVPFQERGVAQRTADAWLADNEDAHDALRRLVIEGRDNVRRALKNQAVDAAWGE